MELRKKCILLSGALLLGSIVCACNKVNEIPGEEVTKERENEDIYMKETDTKEVDTEENYIEENALETTNFSEESQNTANDISQWEKGYDLPVTDSEKEETIDECMKIMKQIGRAHV